MQWGVFITVTGFLLPIVLFVRLMYELIAKPHPLAHPASLWRIQLTALLLIPICATLPGAMFIFTSAGHSRMMTMVTQNRTPWGMILMATKAVAIILVDLSKPMLEKLLDSPMKSDEIRGLSVDALRKDLGILIFCIAFAWAVSRWIIL